jgi:hypothetical protein
MDYRATMLTFLMPDQGELSMIAQTETTTTRTNN